MVKGFIEVNDYREGTRTIALSDILEVQKVFGESYPTAIRVASRKIDPWLRVIEPYEKVRALMVEASK